MDLLASVQDAAKHLDGVNKSTDLHIPDTGLAVYAFTTPFILIIGITKWLLKIIFIELHNVGSGEL